MINGWICASLGVVTAIKLVYGEDGDQKDQ